VGPVEVVALTERAMHEHLAGILAIEDASHALLGAAYSEERWQSAEFLRDLPGKWRFSALAVCDGSPRGFWIASAKRDVVHCHRGCVDPTWRGHGLGTALVEFVLEAARRDHMKMVTLSLPVTNEESLRLHERLGFTRARGDELRALLGSKAADVTLGPDYYETVGGQRSHFYVLPLDRRPD
jgi:GNAT superfamily N-acetyltransferase